jgi:hypothetical protein
MDVVQPRAVVNAVNGTREAASNEPVEKSVALCPVRDASEAGILTRHTHPGVPHHEHQEPRLTLREPKLGDGLDAIVGRRHRHNSSANPPCRPAPLPPPLRPPMRRLMPR